MGDKVKIKGKIHVRYETEDEVEYYCNDKRHREDDGPAVINTRYGWAAWYKNGLLHRENGPAEREDCREYWYKDGQLHREDGPAVTTTAVKIWYKNGKYHRLDGPAIIRNRDDGSISKLEYWVEGTNYDKEEFDDLTAPKK